MNQKLKARAKGIFERSKDIETLYVNKDGNFFTSKNLALNSAEKAEEIEQITKEQVFEVAEKAPKNLILSAADNTKICFVDLDSQDTPAKGDKAKIGKANAEGLFAINPQISYKFEKGILTQIIENK